MRRASHQHATDILVEDKEKLYEVRRLASKNMAENMAEMEENPAELRRVTLCKMDHMEEKEAYMAREMRRKNCCMKT